MDSTFFAQNAIVAIALMVGVFIIPKILEYFIGSTIFSFKHFFIPIYKYVFKPIRKIIDNYLHYIIGIVAILLFLYVMFFQ